MTPTRPTLSITATVGKGDLADIAAELRAFARERDWEKFHNAKNLAASVSVEAAELLEIFQWLTPEEAGSLGRRQLDQASLEMADVLIYLVRLSDVLGLDLNEAVARKIELNRLRYPADAVRGRADLKPTE